MSGTKKYNNPTKGKRRYKKNSNIHFIYLGVTCQIILDEWNIVINVEGYEEFIGEFLSIDDTSPVEQFEIAKDSLLWQDYFNSLKSILIYITNEIESDYEYYKENKPKHARNHPMKQMMDLKQSELKILKLYMMSLESQISLMGKIHFKAKQNFGQNNIS